MIIVIFMMSTDLTVIIPLASPAFATAVAAPILKL